MPTYTFKITKLEENVEEEILCQEIQGKSPSEIIEKAEEILEDKKVDIGLFSVNMEITLRPVKGDSYHKMKWNKPLFNGKDGYYKGWDFYSNGELYTPPKFGFKKTHLIPITFGSINIIFLLFSIYLISKKDDFLLSVVFGVFMMGLVYSAFLPIIRSNFNDSVENKKKIILFNIELEFPIWIAAIIALLNLTSKGITSQIEMNLWNIIFIVVGFFFVKIVLSISFDSEKFQNNKRKG